MDKRYELDESVLNMDFSDEIPDFSFGPAEGAVNRISVAKTKIAVPMKAKPISDTEDEAQVRQEMGVRGWMRFMFGGAGEGTSGPSAMRIFGGGMLFLVMLSGLLAGFDKFAFDRILGAAMVVFFGAGAVGTLAYMFLPGLALWYGPFMGFIVLLLIGSYALRALGLAMELVGGGFEVKTDKYGQPWMNGVYIGSEDLKPRGGEYRF